MVITHKNDIPDERIKSMLCSALEGGSNYWYMIERYEYAEGVTEADFAEGGKFYDADWSMPCYAVPFAEGCAVIFSDKERDAEKDEGVEQELFRLDRAAIERGLVLMADKHFRHFANFLNEDDDAETADVFLQCCLL